MKQKLSGKLRRLVRPLSDWNGVDIPIGSVGIYIQVRPTEKGGVRLSFSTMQKP